MKCAFCGYDGLFLTYEILEDKVPDEIEIEVGAECYGCGMEVFNTFSCTIDNPDPELFAVRSFEKLYNEATKEEPLKKNKQEGG